MEPHSNLLLAWVVNAVLPILTWGLMGNYRSPRIAWWCMGNAILAAAALAWFAMGPADALLKSSIAFLGVPLSSIFCAYALQLETDKRIPPAWAGLFILLVFLGHILIHQYGGMELRKVFTQFVHIGCLSYLCMYAFTIHREQQFPNAQWLAYCYTPALIGMLYFPSSALFAGVRHAESYFHPDIDTPFNLALLLTAVTSQFAYLALALEKSFRLHGMSSLPGKETPAKIETLAHANRQKILLELTPYLAHEISQPVSSIVLEAQYIETLLQKTLAVDNDVLAAAKRISVSAKVASDILSFAPD